MSDPHPHPHGEETVADEPPPDPHYLALDDEHKAEADHMVAFIQEVQDAYDRNLQTVLGGAVFNLGALLITQWARILHLEQQLQELKSQHQRHVHDDSGLSR